MPVWYEDATVVDRSDLIVVGHLKENSIGYLAHPNTAAEDQILMGYSQQSGISNAAPYPLRWEHPAILVISEVIKGKSTNHEIPIIIGQGLDVVYGRDARDDEMEGFNPASRKDYPKNFVRLFEKQYSSMIWPDLPVVDDARKDYVWFLSRGGGAGTMGDTNALGVMCRQDIQPEAMKGYFEAYLSDHREEAVKAYADEHPEVAFRAQRWLDRLATTREWEGVKAIKDPQAKARAMATYMRETTAPKGAGMLYTELREEVPKLGADAVPELIEVLRAGMTNGEDLNLPVLILYGIGKPAAPAVPVLCELLQNPGKTAQYYICSALKSAEDPKAIPFVRPILKLPDMQAATEAAVALEAMGDKDSFDAIAALLPHLKPVRSSMDEMHLRELLKVLHSMDKERAAPIVKRYLDDPDMAESRDFLNPGN